MRNAQHTALLATLLAALITGPTPAAPPAPTDTLRHTTPSHTLQVWSKSLDQRPNSLLRNRTHAHPSFNAIAYAFGHANSKSVRLRFHHPNRTLDTGAGQVLMGPAFPPLAIPPAGIDPRNTNADTQRLLAPLLTPTQIIRQHPGLTTPFASLSRHGKRWFLYHQRGRFPVPQPPLAAPVISPDARHVAFVTRRAPGRPQRLAFADTENPFDPIALGPAFAHIHPAPTFSPDSDTLAHTATTLPTPGQPAQTILVLNHLRPGQHQTLGPFNTILSDPVFCPDSQRLTILVNHQGQNRLATFTKHPDHHNFTGPTLGPAFLSILHPAYLPDGRLVHWARTAPGQWQLVIDHQPDPDYTSDTPGQFTFTPTLNPTTGQATLAATIKQDGYAYAVIDGQRGPATQAIGQHSLRLSPDGRSVAYAVQYQHQWFIALNHRPLPPHDQIAPHTLRFSPDSQRFAYAALDRSRGPAAWQLYADEHPVFHTPLPAAPAALTFTHDSQHLISHALLTPTTPEAHVFHGWSAPTQTPAPPSTSPLPTAAVYLNAEPVLLTNAPLFTHDPA
ncbi:MAG: hypothetical protein AAF750_11780, partial [Planctomycetota bacterium]